MMDTRICILDGCDGSLAGRPRNAMYCRGRCRQKAHEQRKRDERLATDARICSSPNCENSIAGRSTAARYCSSKCHYDTYNKSDAGRTRQRRYQHTDKFKAVLRKHDQRPETKRRKREHIRIYRQRPEVKQRSRLQWSGRRARKREQRGIVSRDIEQRLILAQGGRCAYCCDVLVEHHIDHIVPLSRGGLHADTNLQLLCPSCNLSKSAALTEDWAVRAAATRGPLQPQLRLVE